MILRAQEQYCSKCGAIFCKGVWWIGNREIEKDLKKLQAIKRKEGKMRELKFRLRIGNEIVGYEKWNIGTGDNAGWLYCKNPNGKYPDNVWRPDYIYHTEKDQFLGKRGGREIDKPITKVNRDYAEQFNGQGAELSRLTKIEILMNHMADKVDQIIEKVIGGFFYGQGP